MRHTNLVRTSLTVILLLVVFIASSFPWSLYGMNWTDNSQIFHFANRIANGEFPYRDFSYQTGFIGISIDALFQRILGQTYLTSMIVRLLVKIGMLFCFYATFRQFVSRLNAATICISLAFYFPILGGGGNTNWADFFIAVAILFLTLGCNQLGNRTAIGQLAIAGLALSGAIGSRQSNGMICAIVIFSVLFIYTLRKPKQYFKQLLLPFTVGLGIGLSLMIAILGANSALSAAYYELFVAASERKNVSLLSSLIDALSGGVWINPLTNPIDLLQSVIKLVLIPLTGTIAVFLLLNQFKTTEFAAEPQTNAKGKSAFYQLLNLPSIFKFVSHHRDTPLSQQQANSSSTLAQSGIAILPIIVMIGITIKGVLQSQEEVSHFSLLFYDFPRTFFSLTLAFGCCFPQLSQRLLGVPHPLFPLITALVLGTVWAMQLSWVGRYYIDITLLIPLVFLLMAMSSKLSHAWKRTLSLCFLAVTIAIFTHHIVSQSFGQATNQYWLHHPMTPVVKVNQEKAIALPLLQAAIQPGDSCFIYGSASVLYTLLQCDNPTRLDITNSDALTLKDAEQTVATLNSNPPQWLIDTGKGNFYITDLYDGSPNFYGPFNQAGARELHAGLRSLLQHYQLVMTIGDFFPQIGEIDQRDRDRVLRFRLYQYQPQNK
jgi:hypothetical protein